MEFEGFGTVAALASGLGVGTVLTAMLGLGKERRAARAAVLAALHEVERQRWYSEEAVAGAFSEAVRELRTTALLARVPRSDVDVYVAMARAAYWTSQDNWERRGGGPEDAGISFDMSQTVRSASEVIVEHVWRPTRARWTTRALRRQLDTRVEALEPGLRNRIETSRVLG